MGTVNGGTIISFTPPSLHTVSSRMPSHHPNGCANLVFQIPSIANAAKKNTNSAERRANHNAVERARRECLNTKFQELAHALPSLAQVRRPSKSIIVQKSLDFIYDARQKDDLHDKEMLSIRSENDLLREEINKLREKLGLDPLPPREESKPSQQVDEAKEDTKINSSKKSNSPEIKIEADNNTTTTTNARESINSTDIQIKTEECRSDDDISNGNTEEDYDIETSEVIESKNTEISQQPIETHHQPQQPCLSYESLLYSGPLLDHSYTPSEFNYTMDISPIEHHIVDPNSLHLQFDHPDQLSDDLYCEYPLHQKMYPSPPYEAAMLEMANHMSWDASNM